MIIYVYVVKEIQSNKHAVVKSCLRVIAIPTNIMTRMYLCRKTAPVGHTSNKNSSAYATSAMSGK